MRGYLVFRVGKVRMLSAMFASSGLKNMAPPLLGRATDPWGQPPEDNPSELGGIFLTLCHRFGEAIVANTNGCTILPSHRNDSVL